MGPYIRVSRFTLNPDVDKAMLGKDGRCLKASLVIGLLLRRLHDLHVVGCICFQDDSESGENPGSDA